MPLQSDKAVQFAQAVTYYSLYAAMGRNTLWFYRNLQIAGTIDKL